MLPKFSVGFLLLRFNMHLRATQPYSEDYAFFTPPKLKRVKRSGAGS
jgi:hypothetical protein